MRATSSASMPAGLMSKARPPAINASNTCDGAIGRHPDLVAEIARVTRPRNVDGTPAIVPLVTRKYFRPSMSAFATARSSRAEVGPCSASAATSSDMSSIWTFMPAAFWRNQRRLASAAVQRNVCSASRDTVPSSMTLPCSSHQGV